MLKNSSLFTYTIVEQKEGRKQRSQKRQTQGSIQLHNVFFAEISVKYEDMSFYQKV